MRELVNNVLLAMLEKLNWTQTNIAVDVAIRKDEVPGTVLNLSCAETFFLESANVKSTSSVCTPGATLRSVTDR